MPVYKNNSGEYYFKINYKRLQFFKRGFSSEAEATSAMYQKLADLFGSSSVTPVDKDVTVKEAVSYFHGFLKAEYKSTTAYSKMLVFNKYVLPSLKVRYVKDISNVYLVSINAKLGRKADSTKRSIIKTAKIFFNFIKRFNPQDLDISILRVPRSDEHKDERDVSFYSVEEFSKFLSVITDIQHQLLFSLLFYYGLRIGELRGIKWKDFLYRGKGLRIQRALSGKTGLGKSIVISPKTRSSSRTYPMLDPISSLLLLQADKRVPDEFIFGTSDKPEDVMGDTTIRRLNEKYARLAKVKRITIHSFRHSCASYLINAGMDYMLVSNWLGHSSPSVTLSTYAHLLPSRKDEVAKFINNGTLNKSF